MFTNRSRLCRKSREYHLHADTRCQITLEAKRSKQSLEWHNVASAIELSTTICRQKSRAPGTL